MAKKRIRKIKKKTGIRTKKRNDEGKNFLVAVLGIFLTIFLVQLSYKGPDEALNLNPLLTIDFFGAQINYLFNLPEVVTTIISVIILIIPGIFFYFLAKEFFSKRR